jgi:molecular chaperone DnaK
MIADAEQNRAEDARLRQAADARNELDATAYQVERRLTELGESVPTHEKARAEMLVSDGRQAIKENAPVDRMRSLTSELQQVLQGLVARQPQPAEQQAGDRGGGTTDDDVIDADFTVNE